MMSQPMNAFSPGQIYVVNREDVKDLIESGVCSVLTDEQVKEINHAQLVLGQYGLKGGSRITEQL